MITMFNWLYALIGFGIGWLGGSAKAAEKKGAQNKSLQLMIGIASIAFLIFSATFGLQWFLMAVVEVIIGAVIGIKMSK
mgnify:FL=1|jgi:hypothetical protein